jgi:5'-nucleotidase (lipoprotein e(P4) family)
MSRRAAIFTVLGCTLLLAFEPAVIASYDTLSAVLWMQTSVEYKASTEQTYHVAKAALVRELSEPTHTAALEQTGDFSKLPPAVIFDLDETVLDNSRFQAREAASGQPYLPNWWSKWLEERSAELVPGAKDFIDFAAQQKDPVTHEAVAMLYVTNRSCDPSAPQDATVDVLRKLGLPLDRPSERLFCKGPNDTSDKTPRRERCAKNFRILLMFGDQLGDFMLVPDGTDLAGRQLLFKVHESMWGERWFQLPNPSYGDWYGATGATLADKIKNLHL